MANLRKQIIDFNLVTEVINNQDNLLLQRDSGTSFRTKVENLVLGWSQMTDTPTTLSGYGITDGFSGTSSVSWTQVVDTPTTLAGYGITDGLSGTYGGAINWSQVTNTPTTLVGYGITDGFNSTSVVGWSQISDTPTTLEGYGIVDGGFSSTSAVNWSQVTDTPTTLAGYGITDGGFHGTLGASIVLPLTRAELLNLKENGQLITGYFYLITDFRTCYDQPDFDENGGAITSNNFKQADIEPIIVFASGSAGISEVAYQPRYPKDKIKYDINWSVTEISENPAFGRITERIDEYNNRTDYDHRNILFKRYRSYFYNLTEPMRGTININGTTVTGNSTLFTTDFIVGNVIYIYDYLYKITSIADDVNMTVDGYNYTSYSSIEYYFAQPEIDGEASNIPYTHTQMNIGSEEEAQLGDFIMDGEVVGGNSKFGDDSQYFTNLYPGLFVMSAYNININQFSIQGDLGANGEGTVNTYTYSTSFNAIEYTIYAKRVFGADEDPSVNHIIIVNANGTAGNIVQTIGDTTNDDLQTLEGLLGAGVTQLHYLLTSKHNSGEDGTRGEMSNYEVEAMVLAYLSNVDSESIQNTLTSLNTNYSDITAVLSDVYLFNDTGIGGEIDDGSSDMYDTGNFIYTDLGQAWKCYEYRKNNIKDDYIHREFTTFQFEKELIDDESVRTRDNYIGNHSNFYNSNLSTSYFMLANNVFGRYSYSNTIGDRSYNNTTYRWFNKNKIAGTFQNNTITRGFYQNNIWEYFTENRINGYFYSNMIYDYFQNNVTNYDFYYNNIGNEYSYNVIHSEFYQNTVKYYFNNNKLFSQFYNNTLGQNCYNNILHSNFNTNNIGDSFENNTIGDRDNYFDFYNNEISTGCKANLIMGNFYENTIGLNFYSNQSSGGLYENYILNFVMFNNFGNNTSRNEIGHWSGGNHFGNDFYENKIGNNSYNNTIGNNFNRNETGESFDSNIIGDDANNNKISHGFYGNTIGTNFNNNVFCSGCQANTIGNDFNFVEAKIPIQNVNFTSSTFVYGAYNKTIILAGNSQYYLNYFDGVLELYITPITD